LMSVITPLYKSAVSTNRIPVVANVVISNVPGPPMPLYMAGAAMTQYFPVSIVTHGLALNITIHSYAGSLDYGLIAAKDQVPKLSDFVKHLYAAHQELMALVAVPVVPTEGAKKAAKKPLAKKSAAKNRVTKGVAKTVKRRG
jgi:diacylglycerol O-acyltransferase / wax synthase